MVYARPRPDQVSAARVRVKSTYDPYRRAISTVAEPERSQITAYIGALGADAAAQRNRANRLEEALNALRAEGGQQ